VRAHATAVQDVALMLDYVASAAIPLGLWLAFMAGVHYDLKVGRRNRRAARGKCVDYIKRG